MPDDAGPHHAWHLLPAALWAAAPADAPFAAASLADEGFVHLTHLESDLVGVVDAFYRDDPRPYVVLSVDLARLTVRWRYDGDGRFPHAYGPLDRAAILAVHAVERSADGRLVRIGAAIARPGPERRPSGLRIGFKTSPQGVDWTTLDETWAAAGELAVFEAAWLNDHLTDMDPDHPGPSFEALTLMGALAHRVPGKWLGHAVLANTFRHPALVAKAATLLDHVTGGRFILGLGAGWFEGEHDPFGIRLPPIGERIDRLVAAVDTIRALFSPAAAAPGGVTRADPFYPLAGATNLPAPLTPGGPSIYLGGQRRRGIELAARAASGWLIPGTNANDPAYLADRRAALVTALEAAGRDPSAFAYVAQVTVGTTAADRRRALAIARACVAAGANEVILAMAASAGPEVLRAVAREVAEPLRA